MALVGHESTCNDSKDIRSMMHMFMYCIVWLIISKLGYLPSIFPNALYLVLCIVSKYRIVI